MTAPQILSFALLGGAVAVFAWGRFRYDLVALVALFAAIVTGDVPAAKAFSGFTSDVVVVIACALVVSAAVGKSGVIETLIGPVAKRLKTPRTQVPALAAATALLSMLTKNVGALAILIPTALRLGRSERSSASALLMPMSFLSLLGGLVTLVGTSTNIIVSQVREQETGTPFAMFDFAPVGLTLTALGLLFVSFGWRLLPRGREGRSELGEAAAASSYTTEVRLGEDWPETAATVADLDLDREDVRIDGIVDSAGERHEANDRTALAPGQTLLLTGSDEALSRLMTRLPLHHAREGEGAEAEGSDRDEQRSIEAVVQPDSILLGQSAARAQLQDRYGIRLLAVARGDRRFSERLRDIRLRTGDMLLLNAGEATLGGRLGELGLLPLAEREVKLGSPRQRYLPLLILAATIVLVATKLLPVAAGFFGAAVLMVVTRSLSMREAYGALEPEVLVLIGALTPLSEAVQHSGGTDLVAHALNHLLVGAAPLLVLGTLMTAAMVCSPFLHNAPTVLVLGPIAFGVAKGLHLNPDAFLMAVATGAGCDFLTPIGHQCNTLVMGPGGYRFGDYWRLGLPLSILVIVVGTPLIAFVFPLS
jgi:di/tricarboxylate transporter